MSVGEAAGGYGGWQMAEARCGSPSPGRAADDGRGLRRDRSGSAEQTRVGDRLPVGGGRGGWECPSFVFDMDGLRRGVAGDCGRRSRGSSVRARRSMPMRGSSTLDWRRPASRQGYRQATSVRPQQASRGPGALCGTGWPHGTPADGEVRAAAARDTMRSDRLSDGRARGLKRALRGRQTAEAR